VRGVNRHAEPGPLTRMKRKTRRDSGPRTSKKEALQVRDHPAASFTGGCLVLLIRGPVGKEELVRKGQRGGY